MGTSWRPLWTGQKATRAWETIRDLTRAADLASEGSSSPTLFRGTSGLALLHAYLSRESSTGEHRERAITLSTRSAELLSGFTEGWGLLSGAAGVGWLHHHLEGWLLSSEEASLADRVDELLAEKLTTWAGPYDLIGGLTGIGLYALERHTRKSGQMLFQRVLDLLRSTSRRDAAGAAWFNTPAMLGGAMLRRCPSGHFNLGLGHGMPSVLPLFAAAVALSVEPATSMALLEDAYRWLMSQKLGVAGAQFPTHVLPGATSSPARSAWCYGDPGVALALICAGRLAQRPAWEQQALEWARAVIDRPEEACRATGATLCHGSAGLGHIFNRLFQSTGDAAFRSAAERWLERTLEQRRAQPGREGLCALFTGDTPDSFHASMGDGIAGAALALLAAVSEVEPAWDRCMLMSVSLAAAPA